MLLPPLPAERPAPGHSHSGVARLPLHHPRPKTGHGENPFTFCPQLLRLHRDHELFEDGDVLRHMYLQDLLISEAEEPAAAAAWRPASASPARPPAVSWLWLCGSETRS
uniref:Zinc finger protein 511 n=1 Tax=Fundulus heteroclitus TaxID=8078 RepID=A0A3Q2QCA8_FUNHE